MGALKKHLHFQEFNIPNHTFCKRCEKKMIGGAEHSQKSLKAENSI